MGKGCKFVVLVVVICMLVTLLPAVSGEEYEASEKVGSELLELMEVTYDDLISGNFVDSGETYSCIIWIQDVEIEKAVEAGIEAAEMTREEDSTWALADYSYTTYETEGLTYVDVELDETASDEYVQTYIEAERETAVEMYSTNNSTFVAENFMARDMSVTYVSKYSPCVFADLSVTKIAELVQQDGVKRIGRCDSGAVELGTSDLQVALDEMQEAVEMVRADEAAEVYDVTGSGVKIGQVEAYCPNVSSVNVNSEYDLTSSHATTVYTIMNMVAPDATYYATGLLKENEMGATKTRMVEQIEWLLDQGVNIINMSATTSEVEWLDSYTELTRWVDHIAYNHDVHFVQASGNNMDFTNEYD